MRCALLILPISSAFGVVPVATALVGSKRNGKQAPSFPHPPPSTPCGKATGSHWRGSPPSFSPANESPVWFGNPPPLFPLPFLEGRGPQNQTPVLGLCKRPEQDKQLQAEGLSERQQN